MSNNSKRTWNFLKNKGYYIALALCAVAVGVAGFVYLSAGEEPIPLTAVEDTTPTQGDKTMQEGSVSVIGTTPGTEGTQPTTVPTEPRSLETMWPVEGAVAAVFAADKLTYNETTRDWRVHHGIDLEAAQGTKVLAAADGTVYTVYADDTWGTTVVIRHEGGYVTTYASLSQDTLVKAGDTVAMGQAIGTVGQSALTEKALGPHVHFAVTCNEQPVDPGKFVDGQ